MCDVDWATTLPLYQAMSDSPLKTGSSIEVLTVQTSSDTFYYVKHIRNKRSPPAIQLVVTSKKELLKLYAPPTTRPANDEQAIDHTDLRPCQMAACQTISYSPGCRGRSVTMVDGSGRGGGHGAVVAPTLGRAKCEIYNPFCNGYPHIPPGCMVATIYNSLSRHGQSFGGRYVVVRQQKEHCRTGNGIAAGIQVVRGRLSSGQQR